LGAVIVRSWTALTIPAVVVRARPNGLPIATTGSPTRTASEFPSTSGVRLRELASTRSTAMSVEGSLPTSVARRVSWLEKLTSIWSAPSITW
jgi:hypothetical protein